MRIHIRQRGICKDCRALSSGQCVLGYKKSDEHIPLEPCPKPISYAQLVFVKKRMGL